VDRTLASCVQALEDAGKDTTEIDEVVLVGGSSRIPLVQRRVSAFFHKEPRRTVNPDEVVALGAAVQAGVLSGEIKGLVLLDVTSLSLGVETHDGQTAVVIPRNTTIPTEAMRTFTTAADGQTSVEVHVVQGESESARTNDSLGRFDLDGLKSAPAGQPQIDVTFAIDLNGMVKVSARDRATGRSQTVSVSARTAVASEPALGVPKIKNETEEPAAPTGDWQPQEPKDSPLPSAAEAALHEAERLLGQVADSIAAKDKDDLERNAQALRAMMGSGRQGEEVERMRTSLRQVTTRIKEAVLSRRAR
jgi:molecular chaperone DnaK